MRLKSIGMAHILVKSLVQCMAIMDISIQLNYFKKLPNQRFAKS